MISMQDFYDHIKIPLLVVNVHISLWKRNSDSGLIKGFFTTDNQFFIHCPEISSCSTYSY